MKRKTRTGLVWLLAFSLFVSTVASTVAVASRIRYFTAVADVESMIPLVPEGVTLEEVMEAALAKAEKQAEAAPEPLALFVPASRVRTVAPVNVTYCAPVADTRFTVSDDRTVWGTNTQVDIFKSEYEDGNHNIVVAGANGDKVIAPGTENAYTFKLRNDFTSPLNYTVAVKAYVNPDGVEIPVVCRLSRYDGHWVAGSDSQWLSIPDFDGARDVDVLAATSYVTYTLDWQWPYEGDDAADTALAERAMEEDVTLTIEIITTAEWSPDSSDDPIVPDIPVVPTPDEPDPMVPVPDEPDPVEPLPEEPEVGEPLPPKTGDDSNPGLWISLAAVSFLLLLILLLRRDDDEEEKKSGAEASP